MPFGLLNAVAAHQRLLRSILEAQEVRHHAVLAEMEMDPAEPPGSPEAPEAQSPEGSSGLASSTRVVSNSRSVIRLQRIYFSKHFCPCFGL